jgi:insulysin
MDESTIENINVIKSPNDKCEYLAYKINSNKLNVFITHDNNADISCVAMTVKIGYMHDSVPGLAHFLEHMLFNGTTKYPDENEFMSFTSKHGGFTNAYTSHNHTCYFYTIQSDYLDHSLDIFGQFFISPLMKKDSVNREKEAVDAEHTKNIYDDAWRYNEILRKACVKNHPMSHFGTGSNKTLSIDGIDKIVRDFYEQYYSSDIMTLFVTTKNDLYMVQHQINNIFGQIKCIDAKYKLDTLETNIILSVPTVIKVVPIEDSEKIVINWDLPSFNTSKHQSPYILLSHILGHEGKNSIHNILINNEYISHLMAGINIIIDNRCIFYIDIKLSPLGSTKRNDIIKMIFDYIKMMIDNIDGDEIKNLYDELLMLNRFDFKYSPTPNPESRTMNYCELTCKYDFSLRYLPTIMYVYDNYDPHIKNNLKNVLNLMTVHNCVIILGSKNFKQSANNEDEHYKTKYEIIHKYIEFPDNTMTYKHVFPAMNPFISVNNNIIKFAYKKPVMMNDIFWLPTNKFNNPNVRINVAIDLPLSMNDKYIHTRTILYFNSLMTHINSDKYLCHMANYDIDISYGSTGTLYIIIMGNVGKIINVCEFIVNALLSNVISKKSFDSAKYLLKNDDENAVLSKPYIRLSNFFNKKMCITYYDNFDRLSVIDSIEHDDIANVLEEILKISLVKILVSGNTTDKLAINIKHIFNKFIRHKIYTPTISLCDLYKTPGTDETLIYPVENTHDSNNAVGFYCFISKMIYGVTEKWDKYICLINILDNIISSSYFDTLRTKEKFGYIVKGSKYDVGDKRCMSKYYVFIVQSPEKTVENIIDRTKQFIIDFKNELLKLTNENIKELAHACITGLLAPPHNLAELADFAFMMEIQSNYLSFDLKNVLVQTYNTITKDDLLKFYDDKFINRKSLIIGIRGN